jgi:hypothetical protein
MLCEDRAVPGGRILPLLLLAGLLLAGCGSTSGSSNGEAGKTAGQVFADAAAAARKAGSVHLLATGVTFYDRTPFDHDLRISAEGSAGRVSFHDRAIELVRVGDRAYVKLPPGFFGDGSEDPGHAAVAGRVLGDRWLVVPEGKVTEYGLLFVGTWNDWVEDFLGGAGNDRFVNRGETKIDGRAAVALVDPQAETTLYVSATGEPLPIKLAGGVAPSNGTWSFSDWGEPVDLDVPDDALELSGVQTAALADAFREWAPGDE